MVLGGGAVSYERGTPVKDLTSRTSVNPGVGVSTRWTTDRSRPPDSGVHVIKYVTEKALS